eukprot:2897778-Pleurochrysis_carterae.AAC.1
MTRSCPAYDGSPHDAGREERLNKEDGVRAKGRGKDGKGVNRNSGKEGRNGSMRPSELSRGDGPDSGGVARRHRLRS